MFNRLKRRHHVVADAARVGNGRILAHPNALVNAAAQMLGKMAVDVGVDNRPGLIGMQRKRGGRFFRLPERHPAPMRPIRTE